MKNTSILIISTLILMLMLTLKSYSQPGCAALNRFDKMHDFSELCMGDQILAGATTCNQGLIVVGHREVCIPDQDDRQGIIAILDRNGDVTNNGNDLFISLNCGHLDPLCLHDGSFPEFVRGYRKFNDIKRIGDQDRFVVVGGAEGPKAGIFIIDATGDIILTNHNIADGFKPDKTTNAVGVTVLDNGFLVTCTQKIHGNNFTFLARLDNNLVTNWVSETILDCTYSRAAVECDVINCNGTVVPGYATVGEFTPNSGTGQGVFLSVWLDPDHRETTGCSVNNDNTQPFKQHIYHACENGTKAKFLAVSQPQANEIQHLGIAGTLSEGHTRYLLISLPIPLGNLEVFEERDYSPPNGNVSNYAQAIIGHSQGGWVLTGRSNVGGAFQMSVLNVDACLNPIKWRLRHGQNFNNCNVSTGWAPNALNDRWGAVSYGVVEINNDRVTMMGTGHIRRCLGDVQIPNADNDCHFICSDRISDVTQFNNSFVVSNLSFDYDAPVPNFSIGSVRASDDGAADGCVYALACPALDNYQFSWTSTTNNLTGSNYELCNVPPGNYCVEIRDNQNVLVYTACTEVVFSRILPMAVNISFPGNGPCARVLNWSNCGSLTYEWTFNGQAATIDMDGVDACGLVPGTYCVSVTDQGGNWNSECFTILNNANPRNNIDNDNSESSDISIFPNPTSDYIWLNFPDFQSGELKIYNASGHLLKRNINMSEGVQKIDFENLAPGIYFLKIVLDDKFYTKKVIKY